MGKPNGVIPLNCFDKALLSFEVNCGRESIGYHGILSIKGELDIGRLNQAIESTLRLHPTMLTVLHTGRFRYYRQIEYGREGKVLEVRDLSDLQSDRDSADAEINIQYERCLHEWINQPLNVKSGFPFKVLLVRKRRAESALIFSFHHSAIDGIRALRFIDEVISRYCNRTPEGSLLPEDVRVNRKGDELLQRARVERRVTKHFYRDMLSHLFHFVFINPFSHPARIFHDKLERSGELCFCYGKIGPTELQLLKAKSKSVGGTVNDILMAACFSSIDKWNRLHGKRSRKISLLVPVDIGSEDLKHILCNQISYISFATFLKERTDSTRLLRRVNAKTAVMLKERRGNTYSIVYFAYCLSRLSLAIMRPLSKYVLFPLYADTVILTNPGIVTLGDGGEEGAGQSDFRIADFTVAPFVFTVMGMNICIATFNHSLGIYIGYTTSRFSKEKAEEFLGLYLDEVRNYQVNPQAV